MFLTILSQGSIGIVLCLTGYLYYSEHLKLPVETGYDAGTPLLLALFLILVATAASFFHLGNPVNAPKAMRNLSGSWLSREILAIGIYALLLVAALLIAEAGAANGIFRLLLLLASVAGVTLLWAMTRVYLIPTIPPWNHWYTPVSFAATTLCLGLVGSLQLMDFEQSEMSFCMGMLTVTLALELLTAFINHRRLAGMDSGFDGPAFSEGNFYKLFITRMAMLAAACMAGLLFQLQQEVFLANELSAWMFLFFALVIIQEIAGRLMFYASYFRVGL